MILVGISEKHLEEFRIAYQKRYGKELSKADALEQATKLLCFLRQVYVPITKERFESIQEYRLKILPAIIAKVCAEEDNEIGEQTKNETDNR